MSQSEAATVDIEGHTAPLPNGTAEGPNGAAEGRELQHLLRALQAMRMGDFSVRMAGDAPGLLGKIKDKMTVPKDTGDEELKRLATGGRSVEELRLIRKIEALAMQCEAEPNLYLKFYGD